MKTVIALFKAGSPWSIVITLLVLVQKTPLSTTTLLSSRWRCRSPPISSASSSPLRCFIMACISLRTSTSPLTACNCSSRAATSPLAVMSLTMLFAR